MINRQQNKKLQTHLFLFLLKLRQFVLVESEVKQKQHWENSLFLIPCWVIWMIRSRWAMPTSDRSDFLGYRWRTIT